MTVYYVVSGLNWTLNQVLYAEYTGSGDWEQLFPMDSSDQGVRLFLTEAEPASETSYI
jgi:hypothetical protein